MRYIGLSAEVANAYCNALQAAGITSNSSEPENELQVELILPWIEYARPIQLSLIHPVRFHLISGTTRNN